MVEAAVDQYGRVDILVNNAGVVAHKLLLNMERAEWERQLAVPLTGPFLVSKYVARQMIAGQVRGKIVNISSVAALMGRVKGGAHCASKAGLTLLTKVLAMELGQYGITVNAVAPGLMETQAQKQEMVKKPVGCGAIAALRNGVNHAGGDIAQRRGSFRHGGVRLQGTGST